MTLVSCCADIKPGEKVLIVSDETTRDIGDLINEIAAEKKGLVRHLTIPPLRIHGQEPPEETAQAMMESHVIFGLTKMSMAHSRARRNATDRGAKYLSLPEYSWDVLCRRAMQIDFRKLTPICVKISELINASKTMKIISGDKAELCCDIRGRTANMAPGWCYAPGSMASPPDVEVNIAPLESATHGKFIVNGSITTPDIGLLDEPQLLILENGAVTSVEGSQAKAIEKLFDNASNPKARIAGEIGLGLNPLATLSGAMLEDEGCIGLHIGFGSNATIGGKNAVPFHVDFVTIGSTVILDDKTPLLENGQYTGEIGQLLSGFAKDLQK